jgi:hypothetical protein
MESLKKNWKLIIFLFILGVVIQFIILEIFFNLAGGIPPYTSGIISISYSIVDALLFLLIILTYIKFAKK